MFMALKLQIFRKLHRGSPLELVPDSINTFFAEWTSYLIEPSVLVITYGNVSNQSYKLLSKEF